MLIHSPQRIGFLFDNRQISQDILVLFAHILHSGIQLHVVYRAEPEKGQFVLLVEGMLDLELGICKGRKERQTDHIEQELEIRTAHGNLIGRFIPQRAISRYAHIGSSECTPQGELFFIPVLQLKVEDRTERIALGGRKSRGIEVYFAHKVRIDDADRPPGSSLRGEVIDIRYLDPIQKETVFGRPAPSYHQVITEGSSGCHSGKRLYDTRNIPVSPRTLFYLLKTDNTQAERTFCRFTERGSYNIHFLQAFAGSFKFDREIDILVGHPELCRNGRFIADERGLKPVASGSNASDLEVSDRIGCRPL